MNPAELTLAIVDTRTESLELLTYALRKAFPKAQITACSQADLLDQRLSPSAVVTRYKLDGEIDGLELVRRMRARHFAGPIILVSNSDELGPKAAEAGADEFLSFDRWAELPAILSARLSKQQGG
jgi:DNA-binding response OmpR family regulator